MEYTTNEAKYVKSYICTYTCRNRSCSRIPPAQHDLTKCRRNIYIKSFRIGSKGAMPFASQNKDSVQTMLGIERLGKIRADA